MDSMPATVNPHRARLAAPLAPERERRSELRGALLVAETLQHRCNSPLALTVAQCELLEGDPRLPADLRERAQKARAGALAAAAVLAECRRLTGLQLDARFPGLAVLAPESEAGADWPQGQ